MEGAQDVLLRPATTKEAEVSVLTLSRQMGSLGDEIAAALSVRLGWDLVSRGDAIDRFLGDDATPADRHLLRDSSRQYLALSPAGVPFIERIEQGLRAHLAQHPAVLVGFGSQALFSDDRDVLHVRVVASIPARIERIREQYGVSPEDAARMLVESDRKRRRYISTVFGGELSDPALYHLTLNTTSLSVEDAVETVLALVARRQADTSGLGPVDGLGTPSPFKHPSEAEFARILDLYGIEWTYEPRTFPTEWDAAGNVVQAFRPDFHLTRFGTYLELTTMDQRHVTEKNGKLKRVRELYPGIDVRIVYRKDFRGLMERFRDAEGE